MKKILVLILLLSSLFLFSQTTTTLKKTFTGFNEKGDSIFALYTTTVRIDTGTVITVKPRIVPPVVTPPTTITRQNLIIESTFESATPFAGWHYTQFCCSYSITASTEKARTGTKSMRIELNKTDATVAASKRAEINENTSEPLNAERWIGASYYFPAATYAPDKDAELIMQFHTDAPTGSPPFSLNTINGTFYVDQAIDPAGGATADNKYFKQTTIGNIAYDKWTDIVVHYKQRTDATGVIEVWINGNKVYTNNGPNNFNFGNYLKVGINKWTWMLGASWGGNQIRRVFYIDDLRFGNEKATFNDVAP